MSRNKFYSKRIELCLTKEQKEIAIELAKINKMRINEMLRRLITDAWEKI